VEQTSLHLCVTKENLIAPAVAQPVRWITDDDIEALAEPFDSRQDQLWSPKDWAELRDQGYLYAGHFRDKRLCSVAGVWKWEEDVWEVIGVATKDEYKRLGLAKAVVHFVAGYILDSGRIATYTPEKHNIASIRTALSVGFHPCTRLVGNEKWCRTGNRPDHCDGVCPLQLKETSLL
jgi:RimJ/RimL family protein N-acetyltransferase